LQARLAGRTLELCSNGRILALPGNIKLRKRNNYEHKKFCDTFMAEIKHIDINI